jgi:uncharacterized protein
MRDFVTGIGIALVLEGVLYAAFPLAMRRAVALALALPAHQLRAGALFLAAVGVAVVAWARHGLG